MSVAPPPVRPAQSGRHRSPGGAGTTGSFAALTAELGELTAPSDRSTGSRHAAPTASFSRAARTAGLSLAALGALAGAGGVATQGLGNEPAPQTGEVGSPSLAAADLAVVPAPEAAAVAAPAVLPAAAPAAVSSAAPAAVTASPVVASAPAAKAKGSSDDSDSDDSDDSSESSSSGGSSVATKAISVAKSKLGDPYKWGSTGPNSFDCSGLMVYSFKQAGKSLPRTSKAQSQTGTKVSMDDLQPGDLIFLYSPVSHVVMYIGDGKVIEAPTSGKNVRIKPLSSVESRAVGARRVA